MNPGIRIIHLPSANSLPGEDEQVEVRATSCPWRMNHKLAKGMKMWKGNRNTTTLLFLLKELEILHQERRGQVKTIVMEHFNDVLFHKSRPANKQHTN